MKCETLSQFLRVSPELSEYFLLHMKAAWNLENSSAFSSSLVRMRRTTCWGRSVKEPRLRTSLPWSSTNSKTFCRRNLVHLYWMYLSAVASRAQTVSTVIQHCEIEILSTGALL